MHSWYYFEPKNDKKYSWIFLILQLWPQICAIRIIILIVKNDILAHCLKKIWSSLTFRQNGRTAKINKNCLKHDNEMARVNRIDSIAFQLDVPYQFGSKIRKFRWEL